MSDWSAAKNQLRDIAKWASGGVIATAASVFAGSSLTNLGALSWPHDCQRLTLVGAGALVGFIALGAIMAAAVRVLVIEEFSINDLLKDKSDAGSTRLITEIQGQYKDSIARHANGSTIEALKISYADIATNKPAGFEKSLEQIDNLVTEISDVISFRRVKERFNLFLLVLPFATLAAIAGFGLFAWAANPPEEKPATKPPLLIVNAP